MKHSHSEAGTDQFIAHFISIAVCVISLWSAEVQARALRIDTSTIFIDEKLAFSTLEKFPDIFDDAVTTVIVRISYGDPTPALILGEIIHIRKLRLVVREFCLGVCASYLFLAAEHRSIEPMSIVAFSETVPSLMEMLKPVQRDKLGKLGRFHYSSDPFFFNEIGTPPSLLYQPHVERGVECYYWKTTDSGTIIEVNYNSRYTGWIPQRRYLESQGVHFDGFWPDNEAELRQAYFASFPAGDRSKLVMATSDRVMPVDEAKARLAATPPCSSQEIAAPRPLSRFGPELDTAASDATPSTSQTSPEWPARGRPPWLLPRSTPAPGHP
jgi:hypothetical protein